MGSMNRRNWDPAAVVFLDFETRSACDLKEHGARSYFADPSTEAISLVLKVDGQNYTFGPDVVASAGTIAALTRGRTLVAHNAVFDEMAWRKCGLPERPWFDTLPCARAAGFPGPLDQVSRALGSDGKDPMGKRLIDLLCTFKRSAGPPPLDGSPAFAHLQRYNVKDVDLLERVFSAVRDFGERDVMDVDLEVNERGIPVDREYLAAIKDLFERNAKEFGDKFAGATGGVNPGSSKQVVGWIERMGFEAPTTGGRKSVNKDALKQFLVDTESFYNGDDDDDARAAACAAVKEAMDIRRGVVRVGGAKAATALSLLEPDGRIRDQLVYFGAHTGRWSSRGLQLHNMPIQYCSIHGVEPTGESVEAVAARERVKPVDVLNAMLRGMVRTDNFLVADYASVEARGLAWIAEEPTMLNIFKDSSKSIYLDMGEKVFGRRISKKVDIEEYILAKALVLGCGYGMSGAKFGFTCRMRDVKTDKLSMRIEDAVKVYRSSYPAIPALWKQFHDAAHAAVRGADVEVGKCKLFMCARDLHLELPSGRPIVYRNARVELRVPAYCKLYNMPEKLVETVVYDSPRGFVGFLYGSKITENVVQALCRDLVAAALVRCSGAGLRPCLHVHDEVVCEAGANRFREFMEIMSTPPSWAAGFPLAAEGYSGGVWTKSPKGYEELAYTLGRPNG